MHQPERTSGISLEAFAQKGGYNPAMQAASPAASPAAPMQAKGGSILSILKIEVRTSMFNYTIFIF